MPTNVPPALCTDTPPQTRMLPNLHSLPFLPARFANPPLPVNLFYLSPLTPNLPSPQHHTKTPAAALSLSLSLALSPPLCLSNSFISRTHCHLRTLILLPLAPQSTILQTVKTSRSVKLKPFAGTQFGEAMRLVDGCWDGRKRCSHREGAGAEQASEENFNVRRQSEPGSRMPILAPYSGPQYCGSYFHVGPAGGKSGPRQTRSPRTAEMTKVVWGPGFWSLVTRGVPSLWTLAPGGR